MFFEDYAFAVAGPLVLRSSEHIEQQLREYTVTISQQMIRDEAVARGVPTQELPREVLQQLWTRAHTAAIQRREELKQALSQDNVQEETTASR